MKAVVTGGAGFIGSHLVRELIGRQAQVHVIDNLSSGKAERIHPDAIVHTHDIQSREAEDVIATVCPDVVFHLAAQADVQHSLKEPYTDAAVNIAGTARILAACRSVKKTKLVFASTSAVYGELERERILEHDPTSPISFYGMSKFTAEGYIRLFGELYGLPYTILRYGNVYGPGQTAKGEGGVIALFMERLLHSQPLRVYGDGEQTRDFIYVQDVVQANLAAINHGNHQTIQISTGQPTSVNRIIGLLNQFHSAAIPVEYHPARPGDIKHSCLDNSKARQALRWEPEASVSQGLLKTYEYWHKGSS